MLHTLRGIKMDIETARKMVNDKIVEYRAIAEKKSNNSADENHESGNNEIFGTYANATFDDALDEHIHKWKRGVLPGQKYIQQCICGKFEEIPFSRWQQL